MKRILPILLLLFAKTSAMATGQISDIIYVNGEKWWLMGRPVAYDSSLYFAVRANLPKDVCQSTACWDDFYAYWSLKDDYLILDSICFLDGQCNEKFLPDSTIRRLFGKYYNDGLNVASWLNDTLRIAKGKMLYYEHAGFFRFYETEMFVYVEKGRVTGKKLFHNHVVKDGFSFEGINDSYWDTLSAQFCTFARKYSALDTIERVVFELIDIDVDSSGHLNGIRKIRTISPRWETPEYDVIREQLEQDFDEFLKAIPVWKVWYINGRYGVLSRSWAIPISLKPRNK